MGKDVCGLKPSSPAGEYSGANNWSWVPILALIGELCSDLLDEDKLEGMAFNDGEGPRDQDTCTEMANRFDQWLEHHTEGHVLETGIRVTAEGHLVSPERIAENPDLETFSPVQVRDGHLKKWVEFLRHCGGFGVW